jgi:hypothetical protein
MNVKILLGFFAGAALASLGTFWLTHRPSAAPALVEAPAPPAPVTSAEPPPSSVPAPVAPKAVAKKHAKAPEKAPRPPPLIANRLPRFNYLAAPSPAPAPTPAPPAPVEIATALPVVEEPAPPPTPVPVAPEPPEEPKAPGPRQPNTITITPGTLIPVRIGTKLSTQKNRPGDLFTGTLDRELVVDGFVIAEKGSPVDGRVAVVQEAGRVRGLSHLAVELTRVHTSDGQTVAIRTARVEKLGPGAVASTQAAEIPTESVVNFKVDQPVTITEKLP